MSIADVATASAQHVAEEGVPSAAPSVAPKKARRVPEGPAPAPVVQRLWVHYARRGRLRFSSHRDFQRAFERALRRAAVPVAFSAGFNPHPKVSYANAAPTGMASEAEYLEVGLRRECDPDQLRHDMDAALAPGLDVVRVVQAPARESGAASLAERLHASRWIICCPGVDLAEAQQAIAAFLAADQVAVQRLTKNGQRSFDARSAVIRAHALADLVHLDDHDTNLVGAPTPPVGEGLCAILDLVVRHTSPMVRPDDVLTGLHHCAGFAPPSPVVVTRLAQGPLEESTGRVADPLTCD